ncbi:MAG: cysteine desulfurase [Candidatus Microgenomates bacterium]
MLDFFKIKKDFPIFQENPSLVYLDSTATSLKPKIVIDKINDYYKKYSANIFRGVYNLSEKATFEYEKTREKVASFINGKINEIVFTRNTTEGLNLIAYSLGKQIVEENDEIVVTMMEHHSNFVPWQILAGETGAVFKVININENGELDVFEQLKVKNQKLKIAIKNLKLEDIVSKKTKILSLVYVSNVLGTVNPIKEIIQTAKKINPNIIVIVDAAQAAPHIKIDVKDLGCDFLVFSSHKMLGPTGVGVLWGKYELLDQMYPFNFGGEMISEVFVDKTIFKEPPHKFEAGTPAIAEVIGLGAAIDYLNLIGLKNIENHEKELVRYAFIRLKEEFANNIKIIGEKNIDNRSGIIAFNFFDIHPHDVASILSEKNICIRSGHHCAQPLHNFYGLNASCRASFYLYNDKEDVEKLIEGLKEVRKSIKL